MWRTHKLTTRNFSRIQPLFEVLNFPPGLYEITKWRNRGILRKLDWPPKYFDLPIGYDHEERSLALIDLLDLHYVNFYHMYYGVPNVIMLCGQIPAVIYQLELKHKHTLNPDELV